MNFNKAKFEISYGISSQLPKSERLEFAFVGRSNVGKSSLINKIFNRKNLARVSAVPGKTATINFYSVEQTLFVDLPGYGFAKVAKSEKHRWSELIEGYFNQDRNVGLVFSLIDMRHPPTKLDLDMLQYLLEREMPFIIVLTKADKLSKNQQAQRLQLLKQELDFMENYIVVPASSENGQGINDIHQIIEEIVEDFESQE